MASTIRWGILGTGAISALFAEGLRSAGAELVAVGSRSRAKATEFASHFGVPRAHEGAEALARDPHVDVVYVATPNAEHRTSALVCIKAGKAVLCEKPFALNLAEAQEVVEAAEQRRVFLMEGMWMRFIPSVRRLTDRLRDGAIGDLRMASIALGHPFAFEAGNRVFGAGGGALLDLGVYGVSLALQLFGPPKSVRSQVVLGKSGVDEQVTVLLGHADGRQSTIGATLRCLMSNDASVVGSDGWARLHEPLYRPGAFTVAKVAKMRLAPPLTRSRLRRSRWLRTVYRGLRASLPAKIGGGPRTFRVPCEGNGYNYEALEVMRCLGEGVLESAIMPHKDTLAVMETLDRIRREWTEV
jgi:predicted dehydrogenase